MPRTTLSNGETVELVDDQDAHETAFVITVDQDASGTLEFARSRENARNGVPIRAGTPARINDDGTARSIYVHANGGGVSFNWHSVRDGHEVVYEEPLLTQSANVTFGTAEVTSPGTPVSLTSGGKVIPPGFEVTVRANTSGGSVYLGNQDVGNRLSGNAGYRMNDTEIYRSGIHNVGTLFIDADSAGDGVHWIVESQDE